MIITGHQLSQTQFQFLASLTKGQQVTIRGYEYLTTGDAETCGRTVRVDAVRRHPGMPSGWELATIMEWMSA